MDCGCAWNNAHPRKGKKERGCNGKRGLALEFEFEHSCRFARRSMCSVGDVQRAAVAFAKERKEERADERAEKGLSGRSSPTKPSTPRGGIGRQVSNLPSTCVAMPKWDTAKCLICSIQIMYGVPLTLMGWCTEALARLETMSMSFSPRRTIMHIRNKSWDSQF